MTWHTVHLDEVAPSPWRNGGGTTRELLAWPNAKDWIWRLSVAEVLKSGPFSPYAGIQRWFAVLTGDGVRLSLSDGGQRVLGPNDEPYHFDGGTPVNCELLRGATLDFNLMARQHLASAHMRRIRGSVQVHLDSPKTVALYAVQSKARVLLNNLSLTVQPDALVWQILPAGAVVQVSADHALWMEIDT